MARYPQIDETLETADEALRVLGRSVKTRQTYLGIIRRFLFFHRRVHPQRLGADHLRQYQVHLARERRLAPGSRNQAASALVWFYREVLSQDLRERVRRSRETPSAPVVLSHEEALRVLSQLDGPFRLIGSVLYGTGVRLSECLRIRVKDLDFDRLQITVRDGKGGHDRLTVLPRTLRSELKERIAQVQRIHVADRAAGGGWAPLPHALHRKMPAAGYSLAWQYIFPSTRTSTDPATQRRGQRHLHPTAVQRRVKRAIERAGIDKAASTHTLRHTFATQILRDGCDPKTVQRLLGHADLRTTTAYLHAVDHVGLNVRSPIDLPDPKDWPEDRP